MRFSPAAEIARELILGGVDIGVTGSDLIHEASENGEENVLFVQRARVRRGRCGRRHPRLAGSTLQHDEPTSPTWPRISAARHGRRLRVATKYINLTRRLLRQVRHRRIPHRRERGATSSPRLSGSADLIVRHHLDRLDAARRQPASRAGGRADHEIGSEPDRVRAPPTGRRCARRSSRRLLLSIMGGVPPGILDAALTFDLLTLVARLCGGVLAGFVDALLPAAAG